MDRDDPALGFFVSWVREFSKHFEQITVICLSAGAYDVPEHVRVFSLGKENSIQHPVSGIVHKRRIPFFRFFTRARYSMRFLQYIWRMRHEYDAVLVHMNAEYALLGGLFWLVYNKQCALWYNHAFKFWKARAAIPLMRRIFFTSDQSAMAGNPKARRMPVGIDTDLFRKRDFGPVRPRSILSLGRISAVKRIHAMLDGLIALRVAGVAFSAHIYGKTPHEEAAYGRAVVAQSQPLTDAGVLVWHEGVPHTEAPRLFNTHTLFVNHCQAGSFDKTILEAMASESLVLISNPVLQGVLPPECFFAEDDIGDFAAKAAYMLEHSEALQEKFGAKLREYVVREHTLEALARELRKEFDYVRLKRKA